MHADSASVLLGTDAPTENRRYPRIRQLRYYSVTVVVLRVILKPWSDILMKPVNTLGRAVCTASIHCMRSSSCSIQQENGILESRDSVQPAHVAV